MDMDPSGVDMFSTGFLHLQRIYLQEQDSQNY